MILSLRSSWIFGKSIVFFSLLYPHSSYSSEDGMQQIGYINFILSTMNLSYDQTICNTYNIQDYFFSQKKKKNIQDYY